MNGYLFQKVRIGLISCASVLILGSLFVGTASEARSVQKTLDKQEKINRIGSWDDLEVGDTIDDSGMMYMVTSTYPRTATVVFLDKESEDYTPSDTIFIPNTVIGDDLEEYKVTAISVTALCSENKVKTVYIGDNVKTIGASAFEGCKNLKEVYIGKRVSKIGEKAFYNCKKLKNIDLYDSTSLKSVGKKAFKKIHKNYKIYCKSKYKKKYQKLFKGKIGP